MAGAICHAICHQLVTEKGGILAVAVRVAAVRVITYASINGD
jgi:hypothetical protein